MTTEGELRFVKVNDMQQKLRRREKPQNSSLLNFFLHKFLAFCEKAFFVVKQKHKRFRRSSKNSGPPMMSLNPLSLLDSQKSSFLKRKTKNLKCKSRISSAKKKVSPIEQIKLKLRRFESRENKKNQIDFAFRLMASNGSRHN